VTLPTNLYGVSILYSSCPVVSLTSTVRTGESRVKIILVFIPPVGRVKSCESVEVQTKYACHSEIKTTLSAAEETWVIRQKASESDRHLPYVFPSTLGEEEGLSKLRDYRDGTLHFFGFEFTVGTIAKFDSAQNSHTLKSDPILRTLQCQPATSRPRLYLKRGLWRRKAEINPLTGTQGRIHRTAGIQVFIGIPPSGGDRVRLRDPTGHEQWRAYILNLAYLGCGVGTVLDGLECDENRHPKRPVAEEGHVFRNLCAKRCPRCFTLRKTPVSNQRTASDHIACMGSLGDTRINKVKHGNKRAGLCQRTPRPDDRR